MSQKRINVNCQLNALEKFERTLHINVFNMLNMT